MNGQSLPAGEYQVKWGGDGPNVDLGILRDGKLVTTIPAHTIELQRKDPQDSVLTKKNGDGTESLFEIHFGGKKVRVFHRKRANTDEFEQRQHQVIHLSRAFEAPRGTNSGIIRCA